MATYQQLLELREYIREPQSEEYPDVLLEALVDSKGVRGAAEAIWQGKAAGVAHLVDISEGGSSRKMSDLHKNFLAIAATFSEPSVEETTAARATVVQQITRV